MVEQMVMDYRVKQESKSINEKLAGDMLYILERNGTWTTRKEFERHGFNDRMCRNARQHSKGTIIAGQKGYLATSCATVEDINHAANTLESQAKVMQAEAIELRRLSHRMIH